MEIYPTRIDYSYVNNNNTVVYAYSQTNFHPTSLTSAVRARDESAGNDYDDYDDDDDDRSGKRNRAPNAHSPPAASTHGQEELGSTPSPADHADLSSTPSPEDYADQADLDPSPAIPAWDGGGNVVAENPFQVDPTALPTPHPTRTPYQALIAGKAAANNVIIVSSSLSAALVLLLALAAGKFCCRANLQNEQARDFLMKQLMLQESSEREVADRPDRPESSGLIVYTV